MILISHPRSGSEWFLNGIKDTTYQNIEIFGWWVNEPGSPYQNMSIIDRLKFMDENPNIIQKIQSTDILRLFYGSPKTSLLGIELKPDPDAWRVLAYLRNRTDLYSLNRNNVRETLISLFISAINKNFHNKPFFKYTDSTELTVSAKIDFMHFVTMYRVIFTDIIWIMQALKFKEEFIFEDLLAGKNLPTTLEWDRVQADNNTQDRQSKKHIKLISNYEDVLRWMDLFNVPGAIKT